jgi:hypothetical protein
MSGDWRYYVQTVRSAQPVDITADFPLYRFSALLYSVWRCIPPDHPMCSTLPGDATHAYPLCSVKRYPTTDYLLCSTLPGDTTLDYPIYYACRYSNRLSALPSICSV